MAHDQTSTASECPFCGVPRDRIVAADDHALAVRDRYPVADGHSLVLPRRHVESWWGTTTAERGSVFGLLDRIKDTLDPEYHPAGYTIGVNDGGAAGQTVAHVHVHLIPRYLGDVADPTGGVRNIIPGAGRYPGAEHV